MVNTIFNWCEEALYYWANILGISYELLNIIIFLIAYPLFILLLLLIIFKQQKKINRLIK